MAAVEILKPTPQLHRGNMPGRKSVYSQAVEQQDILMEAIRDPNVKPSVKAGLSRAWDVLEERKRILRGRPLPGQLRPDLDPVQMARALKRSKQRLIHDIPPELAEPIDPTNGRPVSERPEPKQAKAGEQPKESLSPETVPTPPTGAGENRPSV